MPLTFVVERGEQEVTLMATPERKEVKDRFGNIHRVGMLGIQRNTTGADIKVERYSVPQAVALPSETWFVTDRTFSYLGRLVGRESADQLGGPIRVAEFPARSRRSVSSP